MTEGPGKSRRRLFASPLFIVAVLLVLSTVVLSVGGYSGWLIPASENQLVVNGEQTHTLERGDLVISITERGTVRAARSVPIYCLMEGESTIVSVKPEGTWVNKGETLVELDSSNLEPLLNQQQITVDGTKAALDQATSQVVIQESLNKSEVEAAELAVELAKIDLEKYRDGDYPQAEKEALNKILIAEEELARAEDKHNWSKKLVAKGYISRLEEQSDALQVKQKEVQHEQAKEALHVLKTYTHRKEDMTYKSNLDQTTAAFDRAKRKAEAMMSQAKAEERAQKSTYNLSLKRLKKIEDQLGKTIIKAPQAGMVVYEEPRWRRGRDSVIEQGAQVQENQQLMQLPDTSVMAVSVQVHESWVDQVESGLPARISLDALPNLNLRGHVTKIGLFPDQVNRWLNPELKMYKTEVTIDKSQDTSLLRPGMSAKVQIIMKKLEDVLYVPIQSVTTIDKQQVCYLLDGGLFRPVPVRAGLHNESFLEIIYGLKQGDVIQLNAPSPQSGSDWNKLEDLGDDANIVLEKRGDREASERYRRVLQNPPGRGRGARGPRAGGQTPPSSRAGGGKGAGARSGSAREGGKGTGGSPRAKGMGKGPRGGGDAERRKGRREGRRSRGEGSRGEAARAPEGSASPPSRGDGTKTAPGKIDGGTTTDSPSASATSSATSKRAAASP